MVARKHCNIDDKSEENLANIFGIKPQRLRLTKSNFVREFSATVQTLMDYNNMDVIYWPAGENIFANMLFGSFINVALQHAKEWNSTLQVYFNFLITLFVESFIHP